MSYFSDDNDSSGFFYGNCEDDKEDYTMTSPPDTLRVLLVGFASTAQSSAAESAVLCLPNFSWSSGFLQCDWNFLDHPVTVRRSITPSSFAQKNIFACNDTVFELDNVACSSVWLLNCTRSEAMHNVVSTQTIVILTTYVHFRTNALGERHESPYPPNYGLNSITIVLLEGWLWHWITYEGWYAIKETEPNQTDNNNYNEYLPQLEILWSRDKLVRWLPYLPCISISYNYADYACVYNQNNVTAGAKIPLVIYVTVYSNLSF